MPSFRQATQDLKEDADRRSVERDRRIIAQGRDIDRWTRSLEQRLFGIVAANRGGFDGVMAAVNDLLAGAPAEAAAVVEGNLLEMWDWAWLDVTGSFVSALPMRFWAHRLAPVTLHGEVGEQQDELDVENQWERILSGDATDAEAREIVREAEFGSPTAEEVDAILSATNAPDGLSATERIKTILPADMEQLRTIVRETLSADFEGASAVSAMKKKIGPLLDTDEGINWKAKRIARTEGSRVAEAAQRASWEPVKDLLKGIRTFTAADTNVRATHRVWHNVLYVRVSDGTYKKGPGEKFAAPEDMPIFPAGANCRCYSVQELIDDLYVGVPDVNWGQYEKGMERFRQQERDDLERKAKKKKPKTKLKEPVNA